MKSNMTEFSYSFAVVNELVSWPGRNLTSAPYFPSLRGEAHLGYDVRLDRPGLPLFLQFKLSDCMVRNNAKEIRDGFFPPNTIFYRMYLRCTKSSMQHYLLVDLEDQGEEVYYVAPAFRDPDELTSHFTNGTVNQNSIYAKPSFDGSKGRIRDNAQHHISFMPEGPCIFYSEPEKINVDFTFEKFSSGVEESLNKIRELPLAEKISELLPKMIHIMENMVQVNPWFFLRKQFGSIIQKLTEASEKQNKANLISYISNAFFGCQFLIVQKQEFVDTKH